ncbi:MAG: RBBP9/YdeN family alpha/beta hydrolase [Candidatus Micrarchaeia archaeon]
MSDIEMPDRVFIIHRWDGNPHTDWYKWLASALKDKGFETFVPKMPDPDKPIISAWVDAISQSSRYIDDHTYMVGHSIGCQAILRFLQGSQSGRIKGMLFIAPWLHLKDAALSTETERTTAKPWLETPIDFSAIKSKVGSTRIVMAKEDPYVPVEDSKIFRAELDAKVNIMPLKVHFTEDDGYKELHVALNEFMKLINDA